MIALSCSRKTPDFDDADLTTLASGYTNASAGEHSCGRGRGVVGIRQYAVFMYVCMYVCVWYVVMGEVGR